MKSININNIRPIMDIDKGFVINPYGSYAQVFKLSLPEMYSITNKEYEECNRLFKTIFSIIPDYSIVQKMDIYSYKKYKAKNDLNLGILQKSYNLKFNERKVINHECYLTICKGSKAIINNVSSRSGIFRSNLIPKDLRSKSDFEDFKTSIKRIQAILKDSKLLSMQALDILELKGLLNAYENLNFSTSNYSADIYQDHSNCKIGNKHLSALAINSINCLPNSFKNISEDTLYSTDNSSIPLSLFNPIGLGFKQEHIVNQIFIKENKNDVKERMKANDKMNRVFLLGDSSNQNNLDDSENFQNRLAKGSTPVRCHINVLLWDRSSEALEAKENALNASFDKIGFQPNYAHEETLPLYWSSYPGNGIDLGFRDQTFMLCDYEAATLNIYETNRKDDVSGFGIQLSDRVNGTPISVDVSDLPMKKGITDNRNKVIFGPSGSGKSFFTNHMLRNYLKTGAHILAVDVGDSYERLCILNNGKYLRYDEKKPISFNPLYIQKEDRTIGKLETIINLLFTLWKKDPEKNIDEFVIISDSINSYYQFIDDSAGEIFMCFDTYFEYVRDIFFKNLAQERLNLIDVASYKNVLGMYYKGGTYDYLLNSKENIDLLNDQFIVFELDNIKDHPILFPVVTLMIMDTFITKMMNKKLEDQRKVILIEEAWKAISKAGMAAFIKYLYKTVRKHFGEAILVTQEVDDIVGNEILQNTILKNVGAKILLDQKEYVNEFDEIQTLLSLNNKSKDLILSLNRNNNPNEKYKEVFIGLGNEGSVYGVNLSLEEYATYTTEKTEKNRVMKLYSQYNNMELAIKLYAEELRNVS